MVFRHTFWAIALTLALILGACSSSDNSVTSNEPPIVEGDKASQTEALYQEYVRMHPQQKGETVQATLTYIAEICNGSYTGSSTLGAIFDAAQWNYYKFYATAGDQISLTVNRTSCAMDPAFTLFEGTSTSTDNLLYYASTSLDLTYVAFADDEFYQTLACGPWRDPKITNYTLPSTGWYTLAVYDYGGTFGGPFDYELVVDGLPCDSDGDGVIDDEDDYPNSDSQPTVLLDGCDSGVTNAYLGDGAYMMDLILDCKNAATTHGDFVSCLSHLTNQWRTDGLISGTDKGAITSCGGTANWP